MEDIASVRQHVLSALVVVDPHEELHLRDPRVVSRRAVSPDGSVQGVRDVSFGIARVPDSGGRVPARRHREAESHHAAPGPREKERITRRRDARLPVVAALHQQVAPRLPPDVRALLVAVRDHAEPGGKFHRRGFRARVPAVVRARVESARAGVDFSAGGIFGHPVDARVPVEGLVFDPRRGAVLRLRRAEVFVAGIRVEVLGTVECVDVTRRADLAQNWIAADVAAHAVLLVEEAHFGHAGSFFLGLRHQRNGSESPYDQRYEIIESKSEKFHGFIYSLE
mmetsp:Transcript_17463/g.34761  ORF Transcript_17463/g.34761 Transcript_17463/m.34761 type:complete len:281 (+) Transcript_17463:856-1698(+)